MDFQKKILKIKISDTVNPWCENANTNFALNNCLFASVKLTKNADSDKFKSSSYGIGFDSRLEFSFTYGSMEKILLLFDNKDKDILILGEEPTQGLRNTT